MLTYVPSITYANQATTEQYVYSIYDTILSVEKHKGGGEKRIKHMFIILQHNTKIIHKMLTNT